MGFAGNIMGFLHHINDDEFCRPIFCNMVLGEVLTQ